MAKSSSIRLSVQKGKGFKKCIGCHIGQDGRRQPKRWYLGHNADNARRTATLIKAEWALVKATTPRGQEPVWTPTSLHRIEMLKGGEPPVATGRETTNDQTNGPPLIATATTTATTTANTAKTLTLYQAIDEFGEVQKSREASKQIGRGRMLVMLGSNDYLKKLMPDMPLASVGYDQLTKLMASLASRPISKAFTNGEKKPISVAFVVGVSQHFRQFFNWCVDSDRWTPPKGNLNKLFKIDQRKLMTPEEQHKSSQGPEAFTVDELKSLYANAAFDRDKGDGDTRTQLYILLGLNCGFTQAEIASLKKWEVHLDAPTPFIERPRNKTGVLGKWTLWPETAKLLRYYLAPDKNNADKLALLQVNGNPLLRYAGTGRHDHISERWKQLMSNPSKVRRLGFKYLRKTCHSIARNIGGLEMAEAITQHADGDMAKLYSTRDWDKVSETLKKMREHLQPMFDRPPRLTTAEVIKSYASKPFPPKLPGGLYGPRKPRKQKA